MATVTKTNNQTTTTVNMAPLLLILSRLKEDANQNLGENEKLKGELNSKIDRIIKGTDVTTTAENANELAGIISKSSELRNSGGIGVMAKRIELEAEKLIERYPKEIEELRKEDFKKNFDKELVEKNPNLEQTQLKDAQEYRDLVAENSFKKSIIAGQLNEALEANKEFGAGKLANGWVDLTTTVNCLQNGDFKSIVANFNSLKGKLDGVNLPTGSKEARSFERVMSVLNNPNADDLFSKTRKYLGWADRVDKLTGGWLNKTITDAGVKVFEKIGNQAISEFATNALGQMAEHGFQQGFSNILNGILSGGVQATATTTAGGIGTGVAATGVGTAAVGATGTVAATGAGVAAGGVVVAGGAAVSATGVGAIVVAAVAVLGTAKKIGNTIAEKLGISSKQFLEENFGKVGSFFVKAAVAIVAIPTVLVGAISGVVFGPIIITVILGIVGYQLFQSNLVSSLVPPKGATSTTSTTVEIPVAAGGNYDVTDGTEVKTCNGGEIVVPIVPANFSRQDLYNVAMSLVGKVPYFWAGGYSAKGADPGWNKTLKTVYCSGNAWSKPDHYSCGQKIPSGVDCSGYVLWIYYQLVGYDISDHSSGSMYNKAANGTDGWRFVSESELKVGDIGWKSGHVGIFAGTNEQGQTMFIHAWNVEGCMGKTVYNRFTKFIRPNVKFSDD